jgi:paraquat-inducible protein A
MGLVACPTCAKVWPLETARCDRCHTRLVSRDPASFSRVWAWLVVGLMAYVPANVYPMLITDTLFGHTESTILGGAVDLAHHGAWAVAFVIVLASVGIPVAKFVAIGTLAASVQRGWRMSPARRMQLYELVEFIGRWSMIDVFVVAVTVSLVQFSVVAQINPGPAAAAFALSVIFTMFSARSFDSRTIWDSVAEPDAGLDTAPATGQEAGGAEAPPRGTHAAE